MYEKSKFSEEIKAECRCDPLGYERFMIIFATKTSPCTHRMGGRGGGTGIDTGRRESIDVGEIAAAMRPIRLRSDSSTRRRCRRRRRRIIPYSRYSAK